MNTVAWRFTHPGGVSYVWAMHGTFVMSIVNDDHDHGRVFIWAHASRLEASERCIDHAANVDENGGSLSGEPVMFNLSAEAQEEIFGRATGWWVKAPNLYAALWQVM